MKPLIEKLMEKDIKFMKLGSTERRILLSAFNYDINKLKCQFCKEKVEYDDCGIMPPTDKRRTATITCNSSLCITEYLEKVC